MNDIIIARALHVLGVVIWIGGVSMVTTVILPAIARGSFGEDRLQAFRAVRRRFIWQARGAVILVGATGLYMAAELGLWDRFRSAGFWWMHAMVLVWLLFAFILFVGEPFSSHRRHAQKTGAQPDDSARRKPKEVKEVFARAQRIHAVLLALSLITIFGAVAGSRGWSIF